jgi:hypothetical protein
MPVIIGALGAIEKGLDQNLKVAPRPPVGLRTTEDHTNEHCTHHL